MDCPVYLVFAGVNGAGKSTFYRTGFWKQPGIDTQMARVNADEILREMHGDPFRDADLLIAGKEAVRRIEKLFSSKKSFNLETTLTGRACMRNMRRAKEAGYHVVLYYIGIDSPGRAAERVARRVESGGHPVAEEIVRRRYRSSLGNLSHALDLCDEVIVFDNTFEFVAVARWTNGVLSWAGNIRRKAPWLLEAMQDDELWRA